jgi:hypothetical protein
MTDMVITPPCYKGEGPLVGEDPGMQAASSKVHMVPASPTLAVGHPASPLIALAGGRRSPNA